MSGRKESFLWMLESKNERFIKSSTGYYEIDVSKRNPRPANYLETKAEGKKNRKPGLPLHAVPSAS